MTRAINLILIGLLFLSSTSCSWVVNLIVANDSTEDVLVKYAIPSDTVDNQFYATPKVYKYDKKILKQSKLKEDKRPKNIPADIQRVSEANELEVMLKPGEAVHVGFYLSFQPTHEIISQNGLKVLIRNDSVLTPTHIDKRMKHWRNIRTDLLEIK